MNSATAGSTQLLYFTLQIFFGAQLLSMTCHINKRKGCPITKGTPEQHMGFASTLGWVPVPKALEGEALQCFL